MRQAIYSNILAQHNTTTMADPSFAGDDPFLDPESYRNARNSVVNATISAGTASLTLDSKSLIIGLCRPLPARPALTDRDTDEGPLTECCGLVTSELHACTEHSRRDTYSKPRIDFVAYRTSL